MPNVKNEMNHNFLTDTIKKSKHKEYSEQIVKFISRVMEDLNKNSVQWKTN